MGVADNPITPTFGALLRRHRARSGLRQEELAARAGISVRAVRDLEHDRVARPQAATLHRLATALALPIGELDALVEAADRPVEPAARRAWVGVLGPLLVLRGGEPVDAGPAMPRELLGLLALRAPEAVTRDEIVDVLWGDRPPRSCTRLVGGYARRVRDLLAPDAAVVVAASGYRLDLSSDRSDLATFESLAARGLAARRSDDAVTAERLLGAALDCWRGPVLAGAGDGLREHPLAAAANGRRAAVAQAYADVAIELDQHDRAVERLRPVIGAEPLHEGLAARMVLALSGAGEQAAALDTFTRVRIRLAEHLGVDPGPELTQARQRVLLGQGTPAPSGPVPGQLPADVADFTGRVTQLAALDAFVPGPGDRTGTAMAIVAVTGPAGAGKTSLSVHWAHRRRSWFPDGHLYADLRGHDPAAAVRPLDILGRFLQALGVSPDRLPHELAEATGLYRSLLADRSLLVVLDNAGAPDQVRPLLPGSPTCAVLVTSRWQLGGLVARDGARHLPIDVMTAEESETLLARLLGADRIRSEPGGAADLAALCSRLPLALRLAAAKLAGRPGQTFRTYVQELGSTDRLSTLQIDGDPQAGVRVAFDLSYHALPGPARRLFRLAGLVPGPDFDAAALGALTGADGSAGPLDQLVDAHLITRRAPGRYGFHDLLRLYAAERCADEVAPAERAAALRRLYEHYLDLVESAATTLYPDHVRLPRERPGPLPERFDGPAAAAAWLDSERPNLEAAVISDEPQVPRGTVWRLCDALTGYFWLRTHTTSWRRVALAGLAAAEADGRLDAKAAALHSLGLLEWQQSRYPQAVRRLSESLQLARAAGWSDGEAAALTWLGLAHLWSGRPGLAGELLAASLERYERDSRHQVGGWALALTVSGCAAFDLGALDEALSRFTAAITLLQEIRARAAEGICHGNLAEVYHLLGRYDSATDHVARALALHAVTGDRLSEADALRCLAEVHRDTGRHREAVRCAESALTLAREGGDRKVEAEALVVLGTTWRELGRGEHSAAVLERAVALTVDAGAAVAEARALIALADTRRHQGRPAVAAEHAGRALAIAADAGCELVRGQALTCLAAVHLARGDVERTLADAGRALAVHRHTGHRLGAARTHDVLSAALAAAGRQAEADGHRRHGDALVAELTGRDDPTGADARI
ncbi:BTAD domain-containing putative transcriptional regulator [Dactylosporangium sp. NPDC005572]|uniref:BTAD domain-containing putative transcriptional regulator n=1 Tax=Dactylosporangium sp. NPDC005572 TaxID=3156889 RepID=UPI0033AA89AE